MFIYLDTETTGSGSDDRLCQLAYKTEDGHQVSELFNPGRPISIDAMCVHHITNDMVKDKPKFKGSDTWAKLRELFQSGENVMVAHNAVFDLHILKAEGIKPEKVVCTLKLARHLDTEGTIPRYGLQYLRYYLNLDVSAKAHDALGDTLVVEAMFKRIHAKVVDQFVDGAVDHMFDFSSKPVLYRRMMFGKYKGIKMEEVPFDYLQWLTTTDLEADMAYTVRRYLNS